MRARPDRPSRARAWTNAAVESHAIRRNRFHQLSVPDARSQGIAVAVELLPDGFHSVPIIPLRESLTKYCPYPTDCCPLNALDSTQIVIFACSKSRCVQATLLLLRAPMKLWFPHSLVPLPRLVTVISLALTLPGCGGTATPIAPSVVEQLPNDISPIGSPPTLVATSRAVNTFGLVNGSFTLTLSTSDGSVGTVKGTYAGEAVVAANGGQTAILQLQITETSGIGSTVTAIEADGTRAFIDEGDFALSLLLTSSLTKSPLRVTVRGTSHVSCSASNRILVTLQGTDSTRGFLEITADLHHEVEQSACL